jgi:hypothetical protein
MPQNSFKGVTKFTPCPHCGKPDWCYFLGDLSVCKRNAEPAPGWKLTSKKDDEGSYYYAPISEKSEKSIRPAQVRTWVYYGRDGQPLVRVGHKDDGTGKKPERWQERWDGSKWVKGLKGIKREDIPIYRYAEITEAIALGKTIFIVEGETCADSLWILGLSATTNIAGSGKWRPSDTEDLRSAKVVLCPDRDKPGIKHMELVAEDFPDAQWLYAFPNSPFWNNLPNSGGVDVVDWIEDYKLSAAQIWEAIESRRADLPDPQIPTSVPPVENNYPQMCINTLYSDNKWVVINGKLYKWVGTHYQEAVYEEEIKRIADWCDTTPVQVGRRWKYAYATAAHVDNIWSWVLRQFSYPAAQVNPPGINCLNGIVKINWNGSLASWELVPHNPDVVYTYVSEIHFDPQADSTDCERMLSCLEPSEQKLFIQTMAASLDLATIRKHRGREVKALLCKGHGNNGKDTLRGCLKSSKLG